MMNKVALGDAAYIQEGETIKLINTIDCEDRLTRILELMNESKKKYGEPNTNEVVRFSNVMMVMKGINWIANTSQEKTKDALSHLMVYWLDSGFGNAEYQVLSLATFMDLDIQNEIHDRLINCVKYRINLVSKKKNAVSTCGKHHEKCGCDGNCSCNGNCSCK